MKKLEDIPKKNVFEVPDGYFERLPGIIQSRVSTTKPSADGILGWTFSLRYVVAVLIVMAVGFFWYSNRTLTSGGSVQSQLAMIKPDQLAAYLDEHESTEELIETISWSADDLNDLENSVYRDLDIPHKDVENILDENDIEL
jgi:hypothetical protein